jgi:hypothetical protein
MPPIQPRLVVFHKSKYAFGTSQAEGHAQHIRRADVGGEAIAFAEERKLVANKSLLFRLRAWGVGPKRKAEPATTE